MSDLKTCPFCAFPFEPSHDGHRWRHAMRPQNAALCPGEQITLWDKRDRDLFNIRPGERDAYSAGWDAAKAEDAKIIQALADDLSRLAKTLAPTKGEDER